MYDFVEKAGGVRNNRYASALITDEDIKAFFRKCRDLSKSDKKPFPNHFQSRIKEPRNPGHSRQKSGDSLKISELFSLAYQGRSYLCQ